MKNLLIVIICLLGFSYSCTVDEAKPLDNFLGTHNGNLNTVTCEENPTLVNSIADVSATLTKDSETEVTGVLSHDGSTLFTFLGELDDTNESVMLISNFIYEGDTLFGQGSAVEKDLELQFASKSCPMGDNTFGVTLQFK